MAESRRRMHRHLGALAFWAIAIAVFVIAVATAPQALSLEPPTSAGEPDVMDVVTNWTPDGGHVFNTGAKAADLDASATYPCIGAKRYQWLSPDGIGVQLTWVNCRAPGDALQFGRLYWKSRKEGVVPDDSVFHEADTVQVQRGFSDVVRGWAQGSGYFFLNVSCLSGQDCRELNAAISREISAELPSVPSASVSQMDATSLGSFILTAPLTAWLIVYVPRRCAAWASSSRRRSKEGPYPYRDITPFVRRLRRTARLRRASAVVVAISLLIAWGSFVSERFDHSALWCGAALAALWLRRRTPKNPLTPSGFFFDGTSLRGACGAFVMLTGRLAAVITVVSYLAIVLTGLGMAPMSPELITDTIARLSASPAPWDQGRAFFVAVSAVVLRTDLTSLLAIILVIPSLAAAHLLDRLGLRIGAASVRRALERDTRPHILYLRSFDEDKLKVVARLTRRGILHRLNPLPRRNFEEVLVRYLSNYGPVIAISPPDHRLPSLGAAKVSLSNETWRAQVEEWTEGSLGVVMSATPSEVRAGLAWEIDHVAHAVPNRLMLVRAPWPARTFSQRWDAFLNHVRGSELFRPLDGDFVQDGTHVLVHSHEGWKAVGASEASDWTYAASITVAMDEVQGHWAADLAKSRAAWDADPLR